VPISISVQWCGMGRCVALSLLLAACNGTGGSGQGGSTSTAMGETAPEWTDTVALTSTSTGNAGDTSESSGTSSYDSAGFITTPDGGSGPLCEQNEALQLSMCSVLAQDCAADHKCSPWWWVNDDQIIPQGNACVPVAARTNALGEPCTSQTQSGSPCDDCDASTLCWPSADGYACVAFCSGQEPDFQCPEDMACAWLWNAYFPLCLPRCDPLVPTCGDGFGCVLTNLGDFVCFPSLFEDTATLDEPCSGPAKPCVEGLTCVPSSRLGDTCTSEHGCCRPLCNLDTPDCEPADSCIPFFEEAPPEHATLGICMPS
jgi:hypothetical protein